MKSLIWNDLIATTPFGAYTITLTTDKVYLVTEPCGTCFTAKTEIGAKRKANHLWLKSLSVCIDQPLVALFSNPSNWRKSQVKHDRVIKPYELQTQFSLIEALTVCYHGQEAEVLSLIRDNISIAVWQYNNYGAHSVFTLCQRLAI